MSNYFEDKSFISFIEHRIISVINDSPDFLSEMTASSPRAIGDALQKMIGKQLELLLKDKFKTYSDAQARRSMADIYVEDHNSNHYLIDVKTHRKDTDFNMPNLTSVERLASLYEDDANFFCLLMVSYNLTESEKSVSVVKCDFVPIENVEWSCLTIGALGWGQIQIKNSNKLDINKSITRKEWMLEFCDRVLDFYPKEITKINERITRFEQVRDFWRER
jgi:hypothetical protein